MRRRPRLPEDGPDPQSFAVLIAEYFEWMRVHQYSEDTIRTARHSLKLFTTWAAERGLSRPVECTTMILERYQRYLYHYRTAQDRPLGIHTQCQHLTALRALFKYLARQHVVLYNAAAALELPRREKRLPRQLLSAAEVEHVLNSIDLADPLGLRDRAMLETLYSTGMRRLELSHLQLNDLDRERGLVTIRCGKGKKDRVIPIGERALAWIEKYLDVLRPDLLVPPDLGWLFLGTRGERLSAKRLSQLAHDHIARANLGKGGSCHVFRHSMATLMLEHGADVRYIQQMLGHAHLTSTQLYTQVSIRALKAVHEATHPGARLRRQCSGDRDQVSGEEPRVGEDNDVNQPRTSNHEPTATNPEVISRLVAEDDEDDD
jgi:integrase/recombinase XerD